VLGPERLSRAAAIDEHDFYAGIYLDEKGDAVPIEIEVIIVGLSPEQLRHFKAHHEFWDESGEALVDCPVEAIEGHDVLEALRVGFRGRYDPEEDDFEAETFFAFPLGRMDSTPLLECATSGCAVSFFYGL
jgi:putative ATP-dependent endonuclease of the OLD family